MIAYTHVFHPWWLRWVLVGSAAVIFAVFIVSMLREGPWTLFNRRLREQRAAREQDPRDPGHRSTR